MIGRAILLPGTVIVAMASSVATPVSAQFAGDRVRIKSPFLARNMLVGTVETLGTDSIIVLSGDGRTYTVRHECGESLSLIPRRRVN